MEALRFSRLLARSPLWPLFSATATHPKIPNVRSLCSQVKIHTATDDKDKVQQKTRSQDHRDIGKQLELFLFHTYSPGSAFFLPHGTRVYNRLTNFLRDEYRQRGYEEVLTPLIFTNDLWKKSGHWENYSSDMYCVLPNGSFDHKLDNPTVTLHAPHEHISEEAGHCSTSDMFLLKPMNCPGHCLIFGSTTRSYRDLPMRLADFSPLHRNESSGTLSGLTRVRKFCQDDAHIFCAENQVGAEIQKCLEFMKSVYSKLGFTLRYRLSTRPEKFIGDLSVWNEAEGALKSVLENLGQPWVIAEGDGAFYGPKIDVLVTDSIKVDICMIFPIDINVCSLNALKPINCKENAATQFRSCKIVCLDSWKNQMFTLMSNFCENPQSPCIITFPLRFEI
eukprot:TRINITY_DN5360_c0_g1_i3.p1 TRINITY_DN5360_c0_g1~~TRINITY_DN5360_c0_g1_i3.p1  ORF type:complete len:392 (+),score=50.01 TRINITY_DN5360_c0_g1_i3:55-1230(+)